jgi:exfoliative toxin A/B
MALMLFSVYFKPWFGAVSQIIWYLAIALHIVMIIYFTKTFILKPDLKKVHASYYIVYVGIAMAAMTAPAYEATGFGMATFWFGFAALLILLVFVTMRYVKLPAPDPAKPLICIYAAPVSLCIAGYIQSAATKSLSFLTVMWVVATVLFLFACVKFVQYLKMPFFPSYAAYTFPFAISAIASKQLMACSVAMEQPMAFLKPIVLIETIIATCTTLYAFVRYLMFLFGSGEKKAA